MFGALKSKFKPDSSMKPKMTVTLRNENPGQAAVPPEKIAAAGVSFKKKSDASVVSLVKKGVSGGRWAVVSLVDRSGSMAGSYSNGAVQTVVERALAWSTAVDNDGVVPLGIFGSGHFWIGDVDLNNFSNVSREIGKYGWGTTNLSDSLDAALDLAKQSTDPVFLFIVTDGAPDDRGRVKKQICALSEYPIFVKFLVLGSDSSAWNFMEELDDMKTGRLVDNVDAKRVDNPNNISDEDFADIMTDETDSWLKAAKTAGLVV